MSPRKKSTTNTPISSSEPTSATASTRPKRKTSKPVSKLALAESDSEEEKPAKKKAKIVDTVDESDEDDGVKNLDEPKKMVLSLKPI
jgi:hypothetical protein